MKLLVRNLAKVTTEKKLLTLFKEYGSIQSCNLILDRETGASKGFAFIEIPKVGEAKAAIKQLNGYKLAGNIIRVKKAETKQAQDPTEATAPKVQIDQPKPTPETVNTDEVWGSVEY